MKKLLAILGLLVLFAGVLQAQDCPFKVKFTVTPATCYNNGKVAYALVDDAGEALTALPPGLSDVRIYYKISEDDSAHYGAFYPATGGWDTLVIDYGKYVIGVEAVCEDGLGGFIKVDTHSVMTVNTSYKPLEVTIVNRTAKNIGDAGTRHTLSCANTGRVQFRMKEGRFPYTISVTDKTNGTPLKYLTFDTNMYNTVHQRIDPKNNLSGYDTSRIYASASEFNYHFYYTVDSLPAGEWEFNFSDGCGYNSYSLYETIETTDLPLLDHIVLLGDYSNSIDSNIVEVHLEFEKDNPYMRMLTEYGEYRFLYDGFQSNGWKKFELIGKDTAFKNYHDSLYVSENDYIRNLVQRNNKKQLEYARLKTSLYDTIYEARGYCDIWGKDITFEYRVNNCGNQTFQKTFQLNAPNKTAFTRGSTNSVSTYIYDTLKCFTTTNCRRYYNSCYYEFHGRQPRYIPLIGDETYNYEINRDPDSSLHVTYPMTITLTDTLNNTIFGYDTLEKSPRFTFPEYTSNYSKINNFYESIWDKRSNIPLKISVVDAKGCAVYEDVKVFYFREDTIDSESYWTSVFRTSDNKWDRCDTTRRVGVSLTLRGDSAIRAKYNPDGVVVKLIESPLENKYNFEATYNAATKDWNIIKSNPENVAHISEKYDADDTVNTGKRLYLFGFLPAGKYLFSVTDPNCVQNSNIYTYVYIADSTSINTITEEPLYEVTRDCSYTYLTIKNFGKAVGETHSISTGTFLDLPVEYSNLDIVPNVSSRATQPISNTSPQPNEQIRLFPGRHIISWSYKTEEGKIFHPQKECNLISYYKRDTIYVDTVKISHSYALALMCEPESTIGTVYVKGDKGMEPYKYVLFNDANMQGDTIGVNTEGKFTNIPMGQRSNFSCQITDDCGSSYHVNMIPSILSNMQKVWFDGGLDSTSTCEGSTVRVNALELGDILSYQWSGPNGFSDSIAHPEVYIPRGAESGWYKVVIRNTGCAEAIVDSIYLTVMEKPTLSVSQGVSECFGAGALVKLSPNSPRSTEVINFTVAYEDNGRKETRSYSAAPKDTVSDNYPSFTAKVYGVSIDDGHCITTLVDDTLQLSTSIGEPIPVTITITCPADVEKDAEVGNCTALAVTPTTLDEPTATHSLGWALEINAQLPADSMLAAGENTVMWIATDRCGNADTCTQKVTVTFPECPSVTDADGNTYEAVRIGCDCWMQRNLESSTYADNSPISWAKGYESFMHPDADANIAVFGRLYDFASAVKDSADNGHGHVQGACPDGWHLPTPAQYSALLGMDATTLKTSEYWIDGGGNNSTGFAWLPAGRYNGAATRFEGLLASSWFWSVEGTGENLKVYSFCTRYSCDTVMEDSPAKGSAYSIRCVKEKE